uniref:Legumain n=1 Tax=Pongo abelii TaxID=9601 RepID=A0A8I5YUE6_PONAB
SWVPERPHSGRHILTDRVSPQARHLIEKSVRKIVSLLAASEAEVEQLLSKRAPLTGHSCYPEALLHFRTHCFNWHSPTDKIVHGPRVPRSLLKSCLLEAFPSVSAPPIVC